MNQAEADNDKIDPGQKTEATYQGLEGRIIRLEEFRKTAATREWVYSKGFALIGVVAVLVSTLLATLIRVWIS